MAVTRRTRRWQAMTLVAMLCGLAREAAGQAADAPQDGAAASAAATAAPSGPYLARTPLDSLTATRERPLFLPSRRLPMAPPPIVAVPTAMPVPMRVEDPPHLTLLGIIRSSADGASAVVLDEASHTSLSLKVGDSRDGWVVQAIEGNSVTLQKQQRSATLNFPPPQTAPAIPRTIDE